MRIGWRRCKHTFLRLLEAVVLRQPLGVRHEDVVPELRMLLHQREGLRRGESKGCEQRDPAGEQAKRRGYLSVF